MAIVENKVSAIGDILVIKTEIPVIGITALATFIDITVGENDESILDSGTTTGSGTEALIDSGQDFLSSPISIGDRVINTTTLEEGVITNIVSNTTLSVTPAGLMDTGEGYEIYASNLKFFNKEFRYSLDGGNTFSDWQELTNNNLAAVPISATDIFIAEYKYTRAGMDPSGDLEFESITLDGTSTTIIQGNAFSNSLFAEFFDHLDTKALTWAVNVLQKVYEQGIVPKYIDRDQDFVDFWKPMTIFFAYLVRLARVYEKFYTNEDLAEEYITQRGGYLCGPESLDELLYIIENYLREISQRASVGMYRNKTDTVPAGELLRLLCYNSNLDEFLFVWNEAKTVGWNINNCSPLYRGNTLKINASKTYESGEPGFQDETNWPIIDSVNTGIQAAQIPYLRVLSTPSSGNVNGIGLPPADDESDWYIKVDPTINYELTCKIRTGNTGLKFSIGLYPRDMSGNQEAVRSYQAATGKPPAVDIAYFIEKGQLLQVNQEYFFRGILWNASEPEVGSGFETNLNIGNHLISTSSLVNIVPYIVFDNEDGTAPATTFDIWDVQLRPVSTKSNAFLDNNRFIEAYLKNNNGRFNDSDINNILRRKMVPYNTSFNTKFL